MLMMREPIDLNEHDAIDGIPRNEASGIQLGQQYVAIHGIIPRQQVGLDPLRTVL